ncbi:MAG: hypothetical protein AB1733_01685 [Thermodesulfobacteriota bacterium]
MKKLIIALTLMTFLASTPLALARGGANYRSAIDRKWNEVQAWQKRQDARFKAIEREAAKGGVILRYDVEDAMPINATCPICVHYRTAP